MIYHKKTKKQKQNKTKRGGKKLNKTIKTRSIKKSLVSFEKEILVKFLEMLNAVKLFHWKTYSFAIHEATDKLYESLNKNIDRFVEIYLGKNNTRINEWENTLHAIQYSRSKDFKSKMLEYREMLTDLNLCFDEKKDSDLLTVRDDILSDLNQFFYLLSFK